MITTGPSADLLLAFEMAPVGLLVSRRRVVQSYNAAFCDMFGYSPEALAGQSLLGLYPSPAEYQHVGERALASMLESSFYADDRIMRKADGRQFWCHVSGRAVDRADPFAACVWVFEDLSASRGISTDLTAREREIAQFLVTGRSSKQIARDLNVSPRTIDAHRARLMRKFDVGTTGELVARLLAQR